MKMDRFFTGLVALVAGLALSAGSALATKGYVIGDPAHMKLVPHYSTGATMSTIVGIQNIMSGDNNTRECSNTDNTGLPADGCPYTADDFGTADDDLYTADPAGRTAANADANKNDPMNLIVTANIHDSMGAMMGSTQLCLGPHQFGYIILQEGMAMPTQMIAHRGAVMSVMEDEIPASGYVTLTGTDRVAECSEGYTTPHDEKVNLPAAADDTATGDTNEMTDVVAPAIAAWTIVQDVGMGFFGTEVPTATITMMADDASTDDVDESTMLGCYGTGATDLGDFMMSRCGLIPEAHDMDLNNDAASPADDAATEVNENDDSSANAHVFARYDVGGDSTVFVWLGSNGDDASTEDVVEQNELEITVRCEEGMSASIDDPSENVADTLDVATIRMGMTMMIDPSMYEVGSFTDMCMGDRGVLQFTMPEGSRAGMVWTHVAQDMDHYRMNFPGYSMAPPM